MTKKSPIVSSSFDADDLFEMTDGVPLAKIQAWLSDPKNRDARETQWT